LREGESLDFGSTPTAVFERKEATQLAAAILPGTGRRLRYRLGPDPDPQGFPILLEGRLAGHSRHFNEDLLAALNTVDALAAAPRDFAWLLEAPIGANFGPKDPGSHTGLPVGNPVDCPYENTASTESTFQILIFRTRPGSTFTGSSPPARTDLTPARRRGAATSPFSSS
jgi:hypothetical protein